MVFSIVNQTYVWLSRFPGELPYPQLSLKSNHHYEVIWKKITGQRIASIPKNDSNLLRFNLGTRGMNTPNTCSVILVAGSELDDLRNISYMIALLREDMLKLSYAFIIINDNPNLNLKTLNVDLRRWRMSPPVVREDIRTSRILYDIFRKPIIEQIIITMSRPPFPQPNILLDRPKPKSNGKRQIFGKS